MLGTMYLPDVFEERDVDTLHRTIEAHPLGALVTVTPDGLDANHIPFLIDAEPAPFGTLHGHVARANPVWRELDGTRALVIFQGPQQFITPSWYPTKQETGRVVPTWNYVVVHAHGRVRVVDDRTLVRSHLERLTDRHEQRRDNPWKVTDAPDDFIDKMAAAVVGIEMTIERLIGKWKVSQNRSIPDREGVVNGLVQDGSPAARVMADLVREAAAKSRSR
jgi:transcriptional regulator